MLGVLSYQVFYLWRFILIDFTRHPSDLEQAAFYARVLLIMNQDGPNATIKQMFVAQGFNANAVGVGFGPMGGPICRYVGLEGHLFIFCLGATTPILATNTIDGYRAQRQFRGESGFNTQFQEWATRKAAELRPTDQGDGYQFHLIGHSAGGGLMVCLAWILNFASPQGIVSVTTFGSPRVADDRAGPGLVRVRQARFMNRLDPIPFLPERPGENPVGAALIELNAAANLSQFQHYGDGYRVGAAGEIEEATLPLLVCAPSTISLLGWASGILAEPVLEHSIATYQVRLEAAAAILAIANAPQVPIIPVQDDGGGHRREVVVPGIIAGIGQILDAPRVVPMAPMGPPGADAPLPASQVQTAGTPQYQGPYYSQRSNGKPCVFCNGVRLIVCRGGKEARTLARRMNAVWRGWNRAPVGDVDGLVQSVAAEFLP